MLEVLFKQRAFLMAAMAHLMEKEVEDAEDFVRFKVAIAQAFTDNLMGEGIMIGDETEEAVLLTIKEMLEKENALQQIKKALRSSDPF